MRQTYKKPTSQAPAALLMVLILFSVASAQEWKRVPVPVRSVITSIAFPSTEIGYFMTIDGQLAKSSDGGASWKLLPVSAGPRAEDMSFISTTDGFFCGRNGRVLKTTDGAATIQTVPLPDTVCWPVSVIALSRTTAVVTALARDSAMPLRGQIWRTGDGGMNWQKIPSEGMGFAELVQSPEKKIVFSSYGRLHSSDDLGKNWSVQSLIDGKPGRAVAYFGTSAIMAGSYGMCAISSDGGKSWTQVTVEKDENDHFLAVAMQSSTVAYIAGSAGSIYRTEDAGLTWKPEAIPAAVDLFDLVIVGNKIFTAGSGGAVYSRSLR